MYKEVFEASGFKRKQERNNRERERGFIFPDPKPLLLLYKVREINERIKKKCYFLFRLGGRIRRRYSFAALLNVLYLTSLLECLQFSFSLVQSFLR